MARVVFGEKAEIDLLDLIWVDCTDQDLVKGNPRHPRREILRTKVGDSTQHCPRGFANIHDFAAAAQDKNPAAETFGDIGKILDFHVSMMTDSQRMSSPEDFDVGEVSKINFGF